MIDRKSVTKEWLGEVSAKYRVDKLLLKKTDREAFFYWYKIFELVNKNKS